MAFWSRKKPAAALARGIHVVPDGGYWMIRIAHQYADQATAVAVARSVSKLLNSELVIHGEDGRIRAKDSHGHDDPRVPG
jgi:hypothetical protein